VIAREEEPLDELLTEVRRCVDHAVERLDSTDRLRSAVRTLIALAPPEPAMVSVPLLVHRAETGCARPAVPVAAAHYLWWVAAHVFDDVIDHATTAYTEQITAEESVMAAVVCGSALPTRVLADGFDTSTAVPVVTEFFWAWIHSNEGQLLDVAGKPGTASSQDVLNTYRRKNGAPYGMACALAARVAGVDDRQVARWREFGVLLGMLGQFRNDQEDVASSRDEDLRNQTATYLLTHLLDSAEDPDGRADLVQLVDQAPHSDAARNGLHSRLLHADHLRGYLARVAELRGEVYAALHATGRTGGAVRALEGFVEQAAEPVGPFALGLAADGANGTAVP
jgi:geranylgeranyl pyrophosphate synthase